MSSSLEKLTDEVICRQLKIEDTTFANNLKANSHLNLGFDEVDDDLRQKIYEKLLAFVTSTFEHIEYIAPVPSGAVGWAEMLKQGIDPKPKLVILNKKEKRVFDADSLTIDQTELMSGKRGIVLDDTTTDGGTSEAYALAIQDLGLQVEGIVSIFFRGDHYADSKFLRKYLMRRRIPRVLNL